jgi:hypothetical protein
VEACGRSTSRPPRAEANARVLGNGKLGSGDYPLLGGGDVNLYSLFVERAQALAAPAGWWRWSPPAALRPTRARRNSSEASSGTGRLGALFDFENRKVLFPDVHARFKFCVLLFGGPERAFAQTRCAFFPAQLDELDDRARARCC